MAIRRFKLASDNHPAFGYATIDEISRGGDFFLETGWTPQAAIVSIAQQFNLEAEFVPTSDAILLHLSQVTPGGKVYDINDNVGVAGGSATTIDAFTPTSVLSLTNQEMVFPRTWYLNTSSSGEADQVTLTVGDLVSETDLYAITHPDGEVEGGSILYFGLGTDVSATYGLDPGTRWETATGVTASDDIAEMVFVDGDQVEGDIYYYYQSYGGGAYDMIVTDDGDLHIQFYTPVDTSVQSLMFLIIERMGEPFVIVRMTDENGNESDPFEPVMDDDGTEHRGLWVRCGNIPKGDMMISYYIV